MYIKDIIRCSWEQEDAAVLRLRQVGLSLKNYLFVS